MDLFQPQSLTDQYLADLDDLDESDREDDEVKGDDMDEDEDDKDQEFDEDAAEDYGSKELESLTKLYGSDKLTKHVRAIDKSLSRPDPMPNTPEHTEDYGLVVTSNELMGELENETVALTKFIRDSYAPRFPELEALILNPLDYVRTVRRIGNENDITDGT